MVISMSPQIVWISIKLKLKFLPICVQWVPPDDVSAGI